MFNNNNLFNKTTNYNQLIVPAGIVFVLVGLFLAIVPPKVGINVDAVWIWFCMVLGFGCILVSISNSLTRLVGLALFLLALILLAIAL